MCTHSRSDVIGLYFGSLQWWDICVWSAPIFRYLDGLLVSRVTLAIIHKRKLVQDLTQRGFPTSHLLRWLALYGYLQFSWGGNLLRLAHNPGVCIFQSEEWIANPRSDYTWIGFVAWIKFHYWFWDHTDSYVVIQSELRSTYVLIRSTYVIYENKYLCRYFFLGGKTCCAFDCST